MRPMSYTQQHVQQTQNANQLKGSKEWFQNYMGNTYHANGAGTMLLVGSLAGMYWLKDGKLKDTMKFAALAGAAVMAGGMLQRY